MADPDAPLLDALLPRYDVSDTVACVVAAAPTRQSHAQADPNGDDAAQRRLHRPAPARFPHAFPRLRMHQQGKCRRVTVAKRAKIRR